MRVSIFALGATALVSCAPAPTATEILWDRWGVPHVYASTVDSVFYAFGWAQMESHGDLLLRLYGQARGSGPEYWGDEELPLARWLHTMGAPRRAVEWYAQQTPASRASLDASAAHGERLNDQVEMVLPIRGSDVLAHMLRVIHYTFVVSPGAVGAADRNLRRPAVSAGSNAWAISPARSASGNALLLANPHLPWGDFFLFYEAHLVGPSIDLYGSTLVGFPILAIAFNEHLGWTHTVNTHDGADMYDLELLEGGYVFDGAVRAFEEDTVAIAVLRAGELEVETLLVHRSVHGPVIARRGSRAVALRVAGLEDAHVLDQYMDMARARSFPEFLTAIRQMQMPMFTTMYADRDGRIMHFFGGRTPRRSNGDWTYWSGVVRGDTSATLWRETHSFDELPRVVDPPSGWLQNANDPPWTTTFPRAIDPDSFPPYMAPRSMAFRPQRSARMLAEDASITFDELIAYKLSTRMELADRILPDLIAAARRYGGVEARAAAQILESWDRSTDAASRGAVLFEAWVQEVGLSNVFQVPWNPSQPRTTPGGLANARAAAAALERAAGGITERYGSADVAWGDVYRLRLADTDLPANGGPGHLGIFRVLNFSEDADGRFRAVAGDTYVALVEFSDPVRAAALTSYGNATQSHTGHVGDQLDLFSRKELRPVWRTRSEIEANLENRTTF